MFWSAMGSRFGKEIPHIPGIDLSGVVETSRSNKFKAGDQVIVVARPFGISANGGLAEYSVVDETLVEKLPRGISLKEAMIIGTSGFTAALCLYKIKSHSNFENLEKSILISGASGAVGLSATYFFSKNNFKVHALSSKEKAFTLLYKLGAFRTVFLEDFDKNNKFPLQKKNFSYVVDNLGGEILSSATSQVHNDGIICIVGIIKSNKANISLLPFVLRGINFVGINAEGVHKKVRNSVWAEIAQLKDKELPSELYNEYKLEDIKELVSKMSENNNIGKVLIKVCEN